MSAPRHYHAIDALRGLAALAVLVWHYQHFYYPAAGVPLSIEGRAAQPFFEELYWLYTYGGYGVQLFWMISGFVFAFRYIMGTYSGVKDFALRRLARLYPLHLATLIFLAIIQSVSISRFGHYQIYLHNDLYHFVLNVFLASNWGFEAGFSFNAPIWSVSVEVLVYALFVSLIPLLKHHGWVSGPMAAGALMLDQFMTVHLVVQCAAYFFGGIFIFWGFHRMPRPVAIAISAVLLASSMTWLSGGVHHLNLFALSVSIVSTAATIDRVGNNALSSAKWLGDMSYALYLLHIPVQVCVLMLFSAGAAHREIVNSPQFFVGFFVSMVVMSLLAHRYYEKPLRKILAGERQGDLRGRRRFA